MPHYAFNFRWIPTPISGSIVLLEPKANDKRFISEKLRDMPESWAHNILSKRPFVILFSKKIFKENPMTDKYGQKSPVVIKKACARISGPVRIIDATDIGKKVSKEPLMKRHKIIAPECCHIRKDFAVFGMKHNQLRIYQAVAILFPLAGMKGHFPQPIFIRVLCTKLVRRVHITDLL
jgi:hypothetical protein